jgi:mono/diheme cytochrome c family protein
MGTGTSIAPSIQEPVRDYATFVIRTGRDEEFYSSTMPAFAESELSNAELEAILTFLHMPPRPTDGEGLYGRFCGNCHGKDALGGRVEKNLLKEVKEGAGEFSEEVREGHGGSHFGQRFSYMPSWVASDLSDPEVSKIVDYLASLTPATTGGDDDDD